MLLHLSVSHSVHRGLSASVHAGIQLRILILKYHTFRLCEYQPITGPKQSPTQNMETGGNDPSNVRNHEDSRESGNSTDVLVHV